MIASRGIYCLRGDPSIHSAPMIIEISKSARRLRANRTRKSLFFRGCGDAWDKHRFCFPPRRITSARVTPASVCVRDTHRSPNDIIFLHYFFGCGGGDADVRLIVYIASLLHFTGQRFIHKQETWCAVMKRCCRAQIPNVEFSTASLIWL
jgi:hypothetical protein